MVQLDLISRQIEWVRLDPDNVLPNGNYDMLCKCEQQLRSIAGRIRYTIEQEEKRGKDKVHSE